VSVLCATIDVPLVFIIPETGGSKKDGPFTRGITMKEEVLDVTLVQ
jgi:hypothetical protein